MPLFKKDLIILSSLILVALVLCFLVTGNTAIDIQLHDTYFVIDRRSAFVLILGPLLFLVFLAMSITRKFKSLSANVGLIIGLILLAIIIYRIIELQKFHNLHIMEGGLT